jgi:hypothetical protein
MEWPELVFVVVRTGPVRDPSLAFTVQAGGAVAMPQVTWVR